MNQKIVVITQVHKNDKYLDNDSMNTFKKDLPKCLRSSGFFSSMILKLNNQE